MKKPVMYFVYIYNRLDKAQRFVISYSNEAKALNKRETMTPDLNPYEDAYVKILFSDMSFEDHE